MKTSKHLFELIKSLTKSEQRYFKLFASTHKESSSYVKLFNAINNQKEYDEHLLRESLANNPIANHLSLFKNRLSKLIMKCLRNYNISIAEKNSPLWDIELLYEKALYKECQRIITKQKKIAYKKEEFLKILELIKWELTIFSSTFSIKQERELDNIQKEESLVLKKQSNLIKLRNLYYEIFHHIRLKGMIRDQQQLEQMNAIINMPLLKSEKMALSDKAKRFYYEINYLYAFGIFDFQRVEKWTKKHIDFLEHKPDRIEQNISVYIANISNLLLSQIVNRKFDSFHRTSQKLMAIPNTFSISPSDNSFILKCYYSRTSYFFSLTGQFERSFPLVKEIDEWLKEPKTQIKDVDRIAIMLNIALIYFGAEKFISALEWNNKIIQEQLPGFEEDINFSRILNLILHYELKNFSLLESLTRSTYRFLHKKGDLYKYEKSILQFINKSLNAKSNYQIIENFKKLKDDLEVHLKDPFEKNIQHLYEITICWLESKIQNKSYANILKEKIIKKSD